MVNKLMDPIGRLMGLRYKSHPWHGVDIGEEAPKVITCFIEMVPTDTVKYEVDSKVWYHDTCWINPNSTGRGIIPGPWLENSNDIWIMCVEP